MPLSLGPMFPITYRLSPPGLEVQEGILWLRFVERFGGNYDGFYFNVRIGEGAPPPEGLVEPYISMATQVSQKRIDAVGVKPDFWEIFEVRERASPGALGQIKMYESLWLADPPDARPVRLTLISDRVDYDVITAAKAQNIIVILV